MNIKVKIMLRIVFNSYFNINLAFIHYTVQIFFYIKQLFFFIEQHVLSKLFLISSIQISAIIKLSSISTHVIFRTFISFSLSSLACLILYSTSFSLLLQFSSVSLASTISWSSCWHCSSSSRTSSASRWCVVPFSRSRTSSSSWALSSCWNERTRNPFWKWRHKMHKIFLADNVQANQHIILIQKKNFPK